MEHLDADDVRVGLESGEDLRPTTRKSQVVGDGPDIQARAADEQCPLSPSFDVGDDTPRGSLEIRDREVLGRIDEIDHVHAQAGALGNRRLRSTDVHPAVHGHRVDAHDLGVRTASCEPECERRLAGSRRSYEHQVAGLDVTGARIAPVRSPLPCGSGWHPTEDCAGGSSPCAVAGAVSSRNSPRRK